MIYSVQRSKPDGEVYLVRYQSEADGGRLDAYVGPLSSDELSDAIAHIDRAYEWEYSGFEDNDDYEQFEAAVVGSPSLAWWDADTQEIWRG